MPRMTTVGQVMVNAILPRGLRGEHTLDKAGLAALLRRMATEYPDRYRDVVFSLAQLGHRAAYTGGGFSFGLEHLQTPPQTKKARDQLGIKIQTLLDDDNLDSGARDKKLVQLLGNFSKQQEDMLYKEGLEQGNPLALQVRSGARGSAMNLASLQASDLLYMDHRGRVIPFPVLRSYSQGLTPAEYWAGTYGSRKGLIDTKFAVQDAGYLSKQLNQIVHRGLITALDHDKPYATTRGMPVDTEDAESEGALLAQMAGGHRRNTAITPQILTDLRRKGVKRILIRSPIVGGPPDGGIYAKDAGIREFSRLPTTGENVSLAAAQALSEPLSQAQLSSKHSGGVAFASAAKAVSGFDRINQMVQIPRVFKGGAAHATVDGLVQRVESAPAGGQFVVIEGQKHYVAEGFDPLVKRGDHVEAGDVISEGMPNPALVVQHKGIGEGRRYFVHAFRDAFKAAGIKAHRRNIELLARGLINHVRLTEEVGDGIPGDVLPYSVLEHHWEPREDAVKMPPKGAVGKYLEQPYLHYSIGTRVRPSVVKDLDEFGVKNVQVHSDPPPFEPEMIRGAANLQHDPDWLVRNFGAGLKTGLLENVHRGGTSNPLGTSFVPGLAQATNFGRQGKVVTPRSPGGSP